MIDEYFYARLSAAFPSTPIAFPGVNFAPPSSGFWFQPVILENEPIDLGLANNSRQIRRGIFRVLVCTRPGDGEIQLKSMGQKVMAAFPKGAAIFGNIRIHEPPFNLSVITEDDRIMLPVSMSYSQ